MIVYRFNPYKYMVVPNAANRDKVVENKTPDRHHS